MTTSTAHRITLGLLALGALALTGGCAEDSTPQTTDAKASSANGVSLTVFAAASLQDSFDQLAQEFNAEHPDVKVEVSCDGSATLAKQIIAGAAVDVFASADEANMAKVSNAGLTAGEPTIFARNSLTIAVPPANPGEVSSVADLGKPNVDVVLCAAEVPCGALSHQVLDRAGVAADPVSEEQNVKAVLTKVAAGEADAGLVYTTDVSAAGDKVAAVALPAELSALTTAYPIAALTDSPQPAAAQQFVDFVTSQHGSSVLKEYGFGSA